MDWHVDPPTDNVGVQAVEIWRRIGTSTEKMIAEQADADIFSYTDFAVPGNQPCEYRVRARDAAGNVQEWSETVAVAEVPDNQPPVALTINLTTGIDSPTLKLTTTGGVMVDWCADPASDPSGVVMYRIYRATVPFDTTSYPAEMIAEIRPSASGELRWHDVLADVEDLTLYYVVTAVDGCGNEGEMAAPAMIVLPDPVPVVTLALSDNVLVHGVMSVSGTIVDNALNRYECAFDTGGGFAVFATDTNMPASGVLGTLDTTKLPDGECKIRLTAFDNAGQSTA
ncbi:MAG TPA: hypothetical protein PKM88_12635, partial [bacterium]|nr:hypothetical protein [bacterium]